MRDATQAVALRDRILPSDPGAATAAGTSFLEELLFERLCEAKDDRVVPLLTRALQHALPAGVFGIAPARAGRHGLRSVPIAGLDGAP